MKKLFSLLAFAAIISLAACDNKKDEKTNESKPAATEAKPADNSAAKHAEPMAEKEHVCADKCKEGNHLYAHGEKGHACTAECGKM